jgi:hypothetical protein
MINKQETKYLPQIKVSATYMRGGTSKGVFFNLTDLPKAAQVPGVARDNLLLRVIGSPDPYAKQTDGMGGATSSTSKTVILDKSSVDNHDVDYLFGQVAIDKPFVDWSGNCGNLTAAVGSFAINSGLVAPENVPENGTCRVRIWQKNIGKTIIANVPICNGQVQETGGFELDGVTFPAAEVPIEFVAPVDPNEAMFPTGNVVDELVIPEIGIFTVTMINAGIPTVFFNAKDLGYTGIELQDDINNDEKALLKFETMRAHAAIKMGLINSLEEAEGRQHTPKIAFVSPAQDFVSSSGKSILAQDIDCHVRALSMGKLHHAMMGTAAVAIGTAAAIEGTIVANAATQANSSLNEGINEGSKALEQVTFAHPSGTLKVGAQTEELSQGWVVKKVTMSRSARILMEGKVHVPVV